MPQVFASVAGHSSSSGTDGVLESADYALLARHGGTPVAALTMAVFGPQADGADGAGHALVRVSGNRGRGGGEGEGCYHYTSYLRTLIGRWTP